MHLSLSGLWTYTTGWDTTVAGREFKETVACYRAALGRMREGYVQKGE